MQAFLNHFLFGVYPYVALTVLTVGSVIRYEVDPFSWKSSSSQLLRRKQFVVGSVLFHLGVLTIFAGHFVGLLTPVWVWAAIGVTHTFKQMLAVTVGGVAGVFTLIGGIILLHRRMFDPRIRATSTFADTGILWLLMIQLVLGLCTIPVSLHDKGGEEMVQLMHWANAIVYFQPDPAAYVEHANLIFKAHIVLGLTIFLLFPFTRLVHMLSAPVRYLWRPGYQIVRTLRGARKAATGLSPMPGQRMEPGE